MAARIPPLQGRGFWRGFVTWGFTPGCHIPPFQGEVGKASIKHWQCPDRSPQKGFTFKCD